MLIKVLKILLVSRLNRLIDIQERTHLIFILYLDIITLPNYDNGVAHILEKIDEQL